MPKVFVGEPFRASLILVTEKVYEYEGGYQDFPSKILCLTVPKLFVKDPFSVSLISGSDKIFEKEVGGGIKICRRKLFVSQCRKFP